VKSSKHIKKPGKKVIIFVLVIFFTSCFENIFGQIWKLRRYEVGAGIGDSQIFGDIGGTFAENNWYGLRDIKLGESRPAFHLYARYKISHAFSTKVNLIYGNGYGSDETSGILRQRSYKTMFGEFSANIEYYFLKELRPFMTFGNYRRMGMRNNYKLFASYLFIGAGTNYSYSTHEYNEIWLPRDDYRPGSNLAIVLPFGVGLKYIIDDHWMIAGELGYRYAFSDFLEGYTQTISSKFKDVYYVLDVSVVYRLKTTGRNLPAIFDRHHKQMFE
jgi:hypothetical protein